WMNERPASAKNAHIPGFLIRFSDLHYSVHKHPPASELDASESYRRTHPNAWQAHRRCNSNRARITQKKSWHFPTLWIHRDASVPERAGGTLWYASIQ